MRKFKQILTDNQAKAHCDILTGYINQGMYNQLPRRLRDLSRSYGGDKSLMKADETSIKLAIAGLVDEYQTMSQQKQEEALPKVSDPQIIISETFI